MFTDKDTIDDICSIPKLKEVVIKQLKEETKSKNEGIRKHAELMLEAIIKHKTKKQEK